MADRALRELARLASAGDALARARLLAERARTGDLPVIPRCPNCDKDRYARANQLKSHASLPCVLCDGTGDLPGIDRIRLASFAGDVFARGVLSESSLVWPPRTPWENPSKDLVIEIPACDRYPWDYWLDNCRRRFGPVAAIASTIGAARDHFESLKIEDVLPLPHALHEKEWCEWHGHVNDALRVFETWVREPVSTNLVKLAGRSDYGRFQRFFEGCDALASHHKRGGTIFWEGVRNIAHYSSLPSFESSLRRAAAAWAREGLW